MIVGFMIAGVTTDGVAVTESPFTIYDTRQQALVARDRLGEKDAVFRATSVDYVPETHYAILALVPTD